MEPFFDIRCARTLRVLIWQISSCLLCSSHKALKYFSEDAQNRDEGKLKRSVWACATGLPLETACCTSVARQHIKHAVCRKVVLHLSDVSDGARMPGYACGRAQKLQFQQHRPAARRALRLGPAGAALRLVSAFTCHVCLYGSHQQSVGSLLLSVWQGMHEVGNKCCGWMMRPWLSSYVARGVSSSQAAVKQDLREVPETGGDLGASPRKGHVTPRLCEAQRQAV